MELSIIVPVYNVKIYLEKCLNSLINQTIFSKTEIILIDDGSSDGSECVCDQYANKYNNITVIHQKNQGVSYARNKGIEVALGKFIVFVDADDYVDNDYCQFMLDIAYKTDADLVVSDYFLTYQNNKSYKYRKNKYKREWNQLDALKEFLSGGQIGVNLFDKMFKKKIIDDLKFDSNIKIGEDLYFIFLYLLKCDKVAAEFKAKYYYVQRQGSAMNTTFSNKFFDAIIVSERINDIILEKFVSLSEYSQAMLIYSKYKTIERAYKYDISSEYSEKIQELKRDIGSYRLIKAFKYFSLKKFAGFFLMRISFRLYLSVCKFMRI